MVKDTKPKPKPRLTDAQQRLVVENIRLVPHALKLMRRNVMEYDAAMSEGHSALCRAARLFDPSRGFAFSTYAMNAIFRSVSGARKREYRKEVAGRREPVFEGFMETVVGDSDTVEDVAQSEAWQRVQDALLQLPLRAQYIIQQRFFGSRTLEQVGNTVGVSKERVRQIQRDSIEQLRELLVEGTPA